LLVFEQKNKSQRMSRLRWLGVVVVMEDGVSPRENGGRWVTAMEAGMQLYATQGGSSLYPHPFLLLSAQLEPHRPMPLNKHPERSTSNTTLCTRKPSQPQTTCNPVTPHTPQNPRNPHNPRNPRNPRKLQASYLLGDDDYLQAEAEDGWVGRLLAALDGQLRWLQPRLTPGAWEGLFHSLLDKLLARLEVSGRGGAQVG
jgi:hypothetical protein